MHRLGLISACVAVTIAALSMPGSAFAHARVKTSAPASAEVLAASPLSVTITFTQAIQKVAGTYDVQVNLDRGQSVTSGPAVIDENDRSTLSVPLKPLTSGRYEVRWKNVSDGDGDPAEGAFSFYVNKQPNTVDLQRDAQLKSVGAEPGTSPSATPPAGATAGATAAAATRAALTTPAQTSAPAPAATSSTSGGDSSNTGLVVFIVIGVAAVAIAGGAGFLHLRGRSR